MQTMDSSKIGALHRMLGLPTGMPIPPKKLAEALAGHHGPEAQVLAEEHKAGVPGAEESPALQPTPAPAGSGPNGEGKTPMPDAKSVGRINPTPAPSYGSSPGPGRNAQPPVQPSRAIAPGANILAPAAPQPVALPGRVGAREMFGPKPSPASLAPGTGARPGSPEEEAKKKMGMRHIFGRQ